MNLLKPAVLSVLFLTALCGTSQDEIVEDPENMVPNWSFESIEKEPCLHMQSASTFPRYMHDWFFPTETHADIFSNNADSECFANPAKGSMGGTKPRTGDVMVGLKTWGLGNTPTFWHEYLMVELEKPLTIGQNYYAEIWVSRSIESQAAANNISLGFSDTLIDTGNRLPLYMQTQIREDNVVETNNGEWVKVSGTFEADQEYRYLIIGNFCSDDETEIVDYRSGSRGAYYFLDDVLVKPTDKKADPLPVKCESPVELVQIEEKVTTEEIDIPEIEFAIGDTVELSNIFFELDKAELLPESEVELMKVVYMMEDYPNMEIEIHGHTDAQGDDTYNLKLSQDRAQAVLQFIDDQKISDKRMTAIGHGETVPIADNGTPEGQAMNRRVEFVIVAN